MHPAFCLYLPYSLKLKAKPRRGGGNMFRHQMETFAVLLEYGYTDPVLLKASLIHDLIEDGEEIGFTRYEEIKALDADGPEVLALVQEMSQREIRGVKEPKREFLLRIMQQGTLNAKILKLADRISNLTGLPHAGDPDFVRNYLSETESCILPFAKDINPAIAAELTTRMEVIRNKETR